MSSRGSEKAPGPSQAPGPDRLVGGGAGFPASVHRRCQWTEGKPGSLVATTRVPPATGTPPPSSPVASKSPDHLLSGPVTTWRVPPRPALGPPVWSAGRRNGPRRTSPRASTAVARSRPSTLSMASASLVKPRARRQSRPGSWLRSSRCRSLLSVDLGIGRGRLGSAAGPRRRRRVGVTVPRTLPGRLRPAVLGARPGLPLRVRTLGAAVTGRSVGATTPAATPAPTGSP